MQWESGGARERAAHRGWVKDGDFTKEVLMMGMHGNEG